MYVVFFPNQFQLIFDNFLALAKKKANLQKKTHGSLAKFYIRN